MYMFFIITLFLYYFEEFIPKRKRRSVEPQPNKKVRRYGALHLQKIVDAAKCV